LCSFWALRRAVRASKQLAGIRVSLKRIRTAEGALNYVFRNTRRPDRKAELPPPNFRGKVFTTTKRFLTKPCRELWKEFRDSRHGVLSGKTNGAQDIADMIAWLERDRAEEFEVRYDHRG
jgi:hypothetical protein